MLPGIIPSTVLCTIKPLVLLHRERRLDARISLETTVSGKDLAWADLVLLCRNWDPPPEGLFDLLARRGVPFLYDIDDNYFELDPATPLGDLFHRQGRREVFEEHLRRAALVRVYSSPMVERVGAYTDRVVRVEAPFAWDLVGDRPPKSPSDPVTIVYATSRIDDELAGIFLPALTGVLRESRGRVVAHFLGSIPASLRGEPHVRFSPFTADYDSFLRRFSRAGYDIGLAPLRDDAFHRSKTNNKYREYGACGVAGIYSKVEVYAASVTDGVNGLLAENTGASWREAIARLAADPELRTRIAEQARKDVAERYSMTGFAEVLLGQIRDALATAPPREPAEEAHPRIRRRIRPHLLRAARGLVRVARASVSARRIWPLVTELRWNLSKGWMLLHLARLRRSMRRLEGTGR